MPRCLFGTGVTADGFPLFETTRSVPNKEEVMTDPRFTDPRLNDPDPRLSDPVVRREEGTGGMWGWIAGVAVLLLIGFLIIAGWNNNSNTASSGSSGTTTSSSAPRTTPPATTGSGSTSTQPLTAPAAPAPSKSQ